MKWYSVKLDSLKIEELEEVIEGYWVEGEELILIYNTTRIIDTVFAIIKNNEYGLVVKNDSYDSNDWKAYKIPKATTRKRTALEVMEYLHTLQLYLSAYIKPGNFSPPDNIGFDDFKSGAVISKRQANPGTTYYAWSTSHSEKSGYFAILKNGEVTEFEIPEIEIK